MKVWRGFTLVFWTVILALCFAVIILHYSLQGSVLNAQVAKDRLANSGSYETIRDTIVADKIMATFEERYPDNKLIDRVLIRETVAEVFPDTDLRKQIDPVVDVVYDWLDSKRPDISFDIPVAGREEQFYRSLEVRLAKKLAALPSCGDYRFPPATAVLNDACLPLYATVEEATTAAMGAVRNTESPFDSSFTAETFSLPVEQSRALKPIPTYLNYLWVLSYVAIAVAVFASILLIVSRKSLGLMAIGVSALLAGIVSWLLQTTITNKFPVPKDPLLAKLHEALLPPFFTLSSRYTTITLVCGTVVVALVGLWWLWKKRRTHA